MGKFLNGLFVGIGIGLFIAPLTGEETRRLIVERVSALRKSMSSEDQQHFSIDAHPPRIPSFPAEPVQPATEFFSEPQGQETPGVAAVQPVTTFASEPQVQGIPSVPTAQPIATFASEPQVQELPSTPPTEAPSTLSDQSANVVGHTSNSADTEQASDSTDTDFVLDTHPDQRTPTEAPRADTAITEKLPPLSSPSSTPSRTTKRKPSTRTPNTGKSRGHKFQS